LNTDQTAGLLLIIGSVVFLVGAAVGVPQILTERDLGHACACSRNASAAGAWRSRRIGLGPIIAAAGVSY
jgi:hypothetical protein